VYTKLDHVGIVVKDIEKAVEHYRDLFKLPPPAEGIKELEDQGLKLAIMSFGNADIEFIQVMEKPGPAGERIVEHLEKKGEGLFHLSIFTEDYDGELAELRDKGYQIDEMVNDSIPGLPMRLAFMQTEDTFGVPIEIVDATGPLFSKDGE
jgi:methylmalonyl-CoA/ethylmalonyl-CoA epimerase